MHDRTMHGGPSLSLVAAAALLGCNELSGEGAGDLTTPDPYLVDSAIGAPSYPDPPYGVAKGDTIKDYGFDGLVDSLENSSAQQKLQLSDFYNPTGQLLFPAGSQYGEGQPKPRALLVNVSALWCAPCKEEAEATLPGKYAELKPLGAEFLVVLGDGPQPTTQVEWRHLLAWTSTFDINYPAGIDPGRQLAGVTPAASFPGNVIVDTATMRIVEVVNGAPNEAFWDKLRSLLAE